MTNSKNIDHIIVLVHGIRTYGHWQEEAKRFFEKDVNFKAYPVRYGYFNLFEFLLPFNVFRKKAADKIIEDIVTIRRKYPNAKLSIISHSFGTYNVSRLLFSQTELDNDVHSLIMCGAIVPNDFPWHLLSPRINGNVRNDFSYLDPWPAIAKAITTGYGAIGTYGAQDSDVLDVRHEKGHSDYFSTPTYEAWKTFIETGQNIVNGENPPIKQGWTSSIAQIFLSLLVMIKWSFLPISLIFIMAWIHPDIHPFIEAEGTWKGTINWDYKFAKEKLFGNPSFELINPISIGDVHFYFNRSTNQWNGFSAWYLKANDKDYARLAVEPKNINFQDEGKIISFDMHALCRQQLKDFNYGTFSEYHISLKRKTQYKYEGDMLITDPATSKFQKVGDVSISR